MLRATGHARMVSLSVKQFMQLISRCFFIVSRCDQNVSRPSGAFCLRQNAQRAALRAAGQATSGNFFILHKKLFDEFQEFT